MLELGVADRLGEPGLPGSADRRQGHQTIGRQERPDRGDVASTPDQARRAHGEVRHAARFRPQRREDPGADLEQVLQLRNVAQSVHPEVQCRRSDGRTHRVGHEDLTAVTGSLDACSRVHGGAEVVAGSFLGLAEVQSHPHSNRRARPVSAREGRLRCGCGRDRIGGPGEGRRERVARRGEDVAPGGLDRRAKDRVVDGQRCRHRGLVGRPQTRRTLDVGEEERDRPGGVRADVGHQLSMTEAAVAGPFSVTRRPAVGAP